MICPNCGRRNSSGATFCSRCRQRLPIATKLNDNHRRTVIVEPRGGGGSGAIVLGVALLAGFLFIGGAAAIYLSNPPGTGPGTDIASGSERPTLPIFVQPTATPSPMPSPAGSPTFILLPSDSPTISPTEPIGTATPQPVITPQASLTPRPTKTPPPTPIPVVAKFTWSQDGTSLSVTFSDLSTGDPTQWQWDFGDGIGTSSEQNPSYSYLAFGSDPYQVTLTVTGPGGSDSKTRPVMLQAPPCDEFGLPPGCIPTPPPPV